MLEMQPAGAPPAPPAEAPKPESGRAAISGVFYSRSNSQVIPGTLFYLRPAAGADGREPPSIVGDPDTQQGDVVGQTDQNGQFTLNDVPPGNYYIFIWAPYDWRPVEMSADDQNLRLIELKPDQSAPLGVLYVAWP